MAANGGRKPMLGFRMCRGTNQELYDFTSHVATLAEIEKLTGVSFFPRSSVEQKTLLNQVSNRGLWPIEMHYFEKPCGSQVEED